MADAAPQTEGNEARRRAMLQAAAELISERGFGETRIADVAKRAGTSSGLVIYYFGTRDRLLVDALRFSEEAYYDTASALLDEESDFRKRLSMLVEWSCVPSLPGEVSGSWGLWLDLWSTALRHPEVRDARDELDGRWRDLIERIVREGQESGRRRRRHRPAPVRAHVHGRARRPVDPGRPRRPGDHLRRRLRHRHGVRRAAAGAVPEQAAREGSNEGSLRWLRRSRSDRHDTTVSGSTGFRDRRRLAFLSRARCRPGRGAWRRCGAAPARRRGRTSRPPARRGRP